jgi:hypothetical protein
MTRLTSTVMVLGMLLVVPGGPVWGTEYECPVTQKLSSEHIYSQQNLKQYRYVVKIDDRGETAILSRCSFSPSQKKVTCDSYEVDKIDFDENVKIKKFYVFRSHFDVQLFSNLRFIENNGRGTIAFGNCRIVSP